MSHVAYESQSEKCQAVEDKVPIIPHHSDF